MALDKMRIKCILGDEIRVVTAKREVTEDELLRLLGQEYGRAIIVSHYEDHEKDVVTLSSSSGLQAVLTEHAELYLGIPLPTLKLFLQPRVAASPEDSSHPFASHNNNTNNSNYNTKPNITNINVSNLNNSGSFYNSSPRNGHVMNDTGINGHGPNPPPRRSSSKLSTPPIIDNPINHSNKPPLEIDMKYINGSNALDAENTPPFRTPPRSPPSSPRNPLRTPPGSPKGERVNATEDPAGFERFPLRVEIDHNPHNHNPSQANNSISPRHVNLNARPSDPASENSRHPHYLLHSEPESSSNTTNGAAPRSNDTPPIRTPPQSPRGSRDDSPPITPSSLPPIPWIPIPEKRSPAVLRRLPPQALLPSNDTPNFPVPQSPQAIPVPIPFPPQKSPRVATPKLPQSIIEQNKHDEEKGPIKWEKGPVIGRGGFGCVYMGMRDNGELIAVKQLEFDETEDAKSRATIMSFAQEINVMKNLRHDNIVRYLGIQLEDKCLNIFLEYIAGGSISTLLGKFMKFPEPVIRVYTKQILHGIAYLHEHHIMHRDIKGANILVDVNGTVKLADFGCSKIFEVKSHLKTVLGTPYWMAPEVIKQSGYGRSADIWSLGCVIIEMATGQPPWQAMFSEVTAAMFHIASTESPPDFPPNLSPEAHDFLSLCFQRNPKERPHAKTLMKHAFLQDVTKDALVRRNSFHGPAVPPAPSTPTLVSPITPVTPISPVSPLIIINRRDKQHFNRAPSTSSPPLPISPFTLTNSPTKYKLELLPNRLLLVIFRLLPLHMQAQMRYVCKHFATVVKDELWRLYSKRSRSITGGSSTSTESSRKVWSDDKIICAVLKGHTKPVHCLALADSFLASGGEDKKTRMWDAKRGTAHGSLKGHTSTVTGLCVDKSSRIYSASADTSVRIWVPFKNGSFNNKKPSPSVSTLTGPTSPLTSIALADSETKLVAGSVDKTICVWETGGKRTMLHTLTGHDGSVNSVRCEGMIIVSASSDSTVKVWDLRTPSYLVKTLTGHVGEVKCCYLANDRLVSGGEDRLVRVWDIGTGRACQRFDHTYPITGVTCDATKVASSGDKVVKLWEWDSDVCARTLALASAAQCVLCEDQRVFVAGQDKLVRVLSPETLTATPRGLFARWRGLELRSS